MDDKKKRALIKTLSVATNFEPSYSEPNRRWFVEKLIRGFEAAKPKLSDAQVESKTRDVVARSKGIVTSKRNFHLKLGLRLIFPLNELLSRPRRVEILYGLIATDPEFADAPNEAFLDFIAARRYRAIRRMVLYVNQLERVFIYPGVCPSDLPSDLTYRVSVDAAPFWERVDPRLILWKLKPQPPDGTLKPLDAIANLWFYKKDLCEANVLECQAAMSCVLMDSLLEAKDSTALVNAVTNRGDTHLAIRRPNHNKGAHLFWDDAATRLFSKEGVPAEDLQVGDHVYVWNHYIYRSLNPIGPWKGEHSILVNCENRKLKNGMLFSGHGFPPVTIARINDEFLKQVNTLLDRAFRLGSIFLEYMGSGRTSIPAANVRGPERVQTPGGQGQMVDVDLYFFDIDYEYADFLSLPSGTSGIPKKQDRGFIVSHVSGGFSLPGDPARPTFGLHWDKDLDRAKKENPLGQMPYFQRIGAPPSGGNEFDPVRWQVIYQDFDKRQGRQAALRKIFKRVRGQLTIERMTPADMPKMPLGRVKHMWPPPLPPNAEDPVLTRPTVLFDDAAYQNFLKTNGAI